MRTPIHTQHPKEPQDAGTGVPVCGEGGGAAQHVTEQCVCSELHQAKYAGECEPLGDWGAVTTGPRWLAQDSGIQVTSAVFESQ